MISRDPMTVSECGLHKLGPGRIGTRDHCPACAEHYAWLASPESITAGLTISGRARVKAGPKNPNARVRGKAPTFVPRQTSDRAISVRGKDGQRQ